jgi:tripartite-type tricarboxylate transporter receptor subunit TctC
VKLPRRQFLHLAAGAATLPVVSRIAKAQTYPTRPVRIVVPTSPGGALDILARLIGQWLFGPLRADIRSDCDDQQLAPNLGRSAWRRAAP